MMLGYFLYGLLAFLVWPEWRGWWLARKLSKKKLALEHRMIATHETIKSLEKEHNQLRNDFIALRNNVYRSISALKEVGEALATERDVLRSELDKERQHRHRFDLEVD